VIALAMFCLLVPGLPSPARAAEELAPGDSVETDWSRAPEYRIVPGDELTLNFGPSELTPSDKLRVLKVRPDGRISVFPVGDVVAAGRTPRDLEAGLRDLLSAELKNPRVTVEVSGIAGNLVHVMGRVKTPGSFAVTPFMTVMQAIAHAGGFEDDAARNSIILMRRNGARTVAVQRIRMSEAMRRGNFTSDPMLSRFDIVIVPRSTIGNVNVFVRQFLVENAQVMQTGMLGWELFNLERVYPNIVRVETSR
jgi:protein involved in polysaccharide export with SLBB domain